MRRLRFVALTILLSAVPVGETAPAEMPHVRLSELPREAEATFQAITHSGPFGYPKDGITFGNRERALPAKPRGFYREYTVKTPGERSRGARRIVCGGNTEGARRHSADPCYYSDDHYGSFRRIVP